MPFQDFDSRLQVCTILPVCPCLRAVPLLLTSLTAQWLWKAGVDASCPGLWQLLVGLQCCGMLCCAVLCCAVLCCAVLCCAVLCCAVLCCAVARDCHRCLPSDDTPQQLLRHVSFLQIRSNTCAAVASLFNP